MEPLYTAIKTAIERQAQQLGLGLTVRPSRRAMLACADYARAGSAGAGERIAQNLEAFHLDGAPLLNSVSVENGWLLLTLRREAFDARAVALPDTFLHGTAYVDRRMELFLRHGDAPLPDCPQILRAVLTASHACARRRWTTADERAVLSMTHGLLGMERVQAEQRAARAAKIILYERRTLL